MTGKETAETILHQLTYGQVNKVKVMTWAFEKPSYGIDKDENFGFLTFKVNGYKFKGNVKISLSFNDTYKIEFIKKKREKDHELSKLYGSTKMKTTTTIEKELLDIYFDQLTEIIDEYVEKQDNYTF